MEDNKKKKSKSYLLSRTLKNRLWKNFLDFFNTKEKAIDHAMWLNFKYRIAKIKFGVIHGPENNWAVLEEATVEEMEMPFLK
ncbi:hypothetical protein [Cellulophaga omnivescoria]|uniref:hypothetical protein n=1 Tax=Cellulophaga omnivescoria TaxID=1888890 RepID=UPI0009862986|nr:hypothetical protein [Cellulophaga omnivescoria]